MEKLQFKNVDVIFTFDTRLPKWIFRLAMEKCEKVVFEKKGKMIVELITKPKRRGQ